MSLRKIDRQETGRTPGYDERSELNDWKGEKLPWNPEVQGDALERMWIALEQLELSFAWSSLAKIWIALSGSCVRKTGELRRIYYFHAVECFLYVNVDFAVRRLHDTWSLDCADFIGVHAMPFRLREPEKAHEECRANETDIEPSTRCSVSKDSVFGMLQLGYEPPKVAPSLLTSARILSHWSSDDRSDLLGYK